MDTGSRKVTVALSLVTALVAADQPVLAAVVGLFYLGVNALLHLKDKEGVDEAGE